MLKEAWKTLLRPPWRVSGELSCLWLNFDSNLGSAINEFRHRNEPSINLPKYSASPSILCEHSSFSSPHQSRSWFLKRERSQYNFHIQRSRKGGREKAYFHHREGNRLRKYFGGRQKRFCFSFLRRGTFLCVCYTFSSFLQSAWWRNHEKFLGSPLHTFVAFLQRALISKSAVNVTQTGGVENLCMDALRNTRDSRARNHHHSPFSIVSLALEMIFVLRFRKLLKSKWPAEPVVASSNTT